MGSLSSKQYFTVLNFDIATPSISLEANYLGPSLSGSFLVCSEKSFFKLTRPDDVQPTVKEVLAMQEIKGQSEHHTTPCLSPFFFPLLPPFFLCCMLGLPFYFLFEFCLCLVEMVIFIQLAVYISF